jgi:hypothetical protein
VKETEECRSRPRPENGYDRHLHSATFDLAGKDEIRSEWNEIAEGESVFIARMHLVRKAR